MAFGDSSRDVRRQERFMVKDQERNTIEQRAQLLDRLLLEATRGYKEKKEKPKSKTTRTKRKKIPTIIITTEEKEAQLKQAREKVKQPLDAFTYFCMEEWPKLGKPTDKAILGIISDSFPPINPFHLLFNLMDDGWME